MVLTPTYYVFKMYVPFQDATFLPVTFNAGAYTHGNLTLPRVDAIAAKDTAGKLWVEITNVDPDQPVEIEVSLSGMTAKSAAGETLTAPEVDSVNNFEAPNTVGLGEVGDDGTFVTRSWPLFSNFDRNHLPAFLREVLRQDRLPGEAVFSDLSFVMCGGPDSDIDLTTPAGTTACPCV